MDVFHPRVTYKQLSYLGLVLKGSIDSIASRGGGRGSLGTRPMGFVSLVGTPLSLGEVFTLLSKRKVYERVCILPVLTPSLDEAQVFYLLSVSCRPSVKVSRFVVQSWTVPSGVNQGRSWDTLSRRMVERRVSSFNSDSLHVVLRTLCVDRPPSQG